MHRISECLLVTFCAALSAVTLGDGIMVPARPELAAMEAGQKAVVIDEGTAETILFQVTYRGAREECAWVVPVPGKPGPQDIDEGSQWFFDYVEALTAPTVVTEGPPPSSHFPFLAKQSAQMSAGMGMEGGGAPTVIEDERLSVGPYQVSVLEATGKGVLGEWLRTHGFQMPPAADRELDGYVGRGWYFVATRVKPTHAGTAPISQGDLPPLAVRFPRPPKLVYPLAISRASVQGRCVVDLTILAPKPVDCDEAPLRKLPAGSLRSGSIWEMLDTATQEGRSSVLLAALMGPALPAEAWCMEKYAKPAALDWSALWATRSWLRPDQARMVDLHLSPSGIAEGNRVLLLEIRRTALTTPVHAARSVLILVAVLAVVLLILRTSRAGRGIATVLVVLASFGMAWAGFSSRSGFPAYERAAQAVTDAVMRFHDLTGCFPAEVHDLTATQPPAKALDASGNEVAVGAPPGWKPLLDEIPNEPASGSRDGWIVDLAAPGYLSSKAFALGVEWKYSESSASGPDGEYGMSSAPFGPLRPVYSGTTPPNPVYLAPRWLKSAKAVALAYAPEGGPHCIWLDPEAPMDETDYLGPHPVARPIAPGPDANSLLDLHTDAGAPPGVQEKYCVAAVVTGRGTETRIGTEPVKGLALAVTRISGTGLIVAGVSERPLLTGAVVEERMRPPSHLSPPSPPDVEGPCALYRVEAGKAPQQLAEVTGLSGLADGGDGKHAFVVHGAQSSGTAKARHVLSLLDMAAGKLEVVAGVGNIAGPDGTPLVVARDGYAWVRIVSADGRSVTLARVSAKGAVDRMLVSSVADDLWPVAPGPGGEALVVVRGTIAGCPGAGDRVVRLGKSAPRVVVELRPADRAGTSDSTAREDAWKALAWPPDAMRDAEALVVVLHHYHARVVVVRRTQPRLLVCSEPGAPSAAFRPGNRANVAIQGTEPQKQIGAMVKGIMPVAEAPSGWLASTVTIGDSTRLSLGELITLGITHVERAGRSFVLVGGQAFAVTPPSTPPVLDCGLDNFALVLQPVE